MSGDTSSRGRPHRVVLASIGTGGFSHLPVLRRLHPAADARLAALLLQAPSELAVLDDAASAEAIATMLEESGLRTRVVPAEAPFVAGEGEFDVAVHLDDPTRAIAVIGLIGRVLGVDPDAARELLFGSPPVLLGNVSAATVEALGARFEALGASLVASRRRDARYDLIVGDCPPRVRSHVLGLAGLEPGRAADGPLVVEDLARAEAERLLAELARASSEAAVVDRAFERFEVRVDACPATTEAERCLIALTGMPDAIAARIPANVPITLLGDVDRPTMLAALAALDAVGAGAVAEMTTFRRQRVRIETMARTEAVVQAIETVTGRPERIGSLPHLLDAVLCPSRAKWLGAELAAAGARASVVAS